MSRGIRLYGAIAVRPAVLPLVSALESATGLALLPRWDLNPTIGREIARGATFDVVITNPKIIDALATSGKVRAGSARPFGKIAMGVAIRAGASPPDLHSVDAFSTALKRATTIAYASEGTSGNYFIALLEQLGIADEVRPKLVAVNGGETARAVGRGETEFVVVPITSILDAGPRVALAGRFPDALDGSIAFDVAVSAASAEPELAERCAAALASRTVDAALAARGIDRR